MMFFQDADPRHLRRRRLRDLVLLGIRMAMVATLAAAFARPVLGPAASQPDAPACTVIILDHSGSMRFEQNGPQRMEMARRAAQDVLSNLHKGDQAGLVAMPPTGVPSLTSDLQFIAGEINDLSAVNEPADVSAALTSAAELFAKSDASSKHLVLISDRQELNWRGVTPNFVRGWRRSVASGPPLFNFIPIGLEDAGNVAIESVNVVEPPVVRGTNAMIEVVVRNYDLLPSTGRNLAVFNRDQLLFQTTVNLDAQAAAVIRCPLRFNVLGPVILTARIDNSGLPVDDTMDVAFEVSDPVGVMIASGDQNPSASASLQSQADFLQLALAPFHAAQTATPDFANLRISSLADLLRLDRSRYPVLILSNVPRLEAPQVRQIEQFVYGGGGLLIAPGGLSQVDYYNDQLWHNGSGVMPAKLMQPVGSDVSEPTSLSGIELDHPVLRFLNDWDDPVPRARIRRFFPIAMLGPQSRVPARFGSGGPFLVAGSFGRGRVLLTTTPFDAEWNNLPLSPSFLPLIQSAVRYLAAGKLPQWNIWAGQPIVAMIDDPLDEAVTVDPPGQRNNTQVPLVRIGDTFEARYAGAQRPGSFMMYVRTPSRLRQIPFAVRMPRDESNLAPFSRQQADQLQKSVGFEWLSADSRSIAAAVNASRRRIELSSYLLVGAVALGLLELVLARLWLSVSGEVQS